MNQNEPTQSVINVALLPNFLFLLSMVVVMGILWYFLEYRK